MPDPHRSDHSDNSDPLTWTLDHPPRMGSWAEELGFVLDEMSGTRVHGHVEFGPRHHQPMSMVHGGAYAMVVESAASIGAVLAVRDRGQFAVGVNNSTDFVRSVSEGRVDVIAEPIMQGRVQQLWRVDLTRASDGKLVAQGRVRLQNLPIPS